MSEYYHQIYSNHSSLYGRQIPAGCRLFLNVATLCRIVAIYVVTYNNKPARVATFKKRPATKGIGCPYNDVNVTGNHSTVEFINSNR